MIYEEVFDHYQEQLERLFSQIWSTQGKERNRARRDLVTAIRDTEAYYRPMIEDHWQTSARVSIIRVGGVWLVETASYGEVRR